MWSRPATGQPHPRLSRRAVLAGAGAGVTATAITATAITGSAITGSAITGSTITGSTAGRRRLPDPQPGISTPPLPFLTLAGIDVLTRDRSALADLLQTWTAVAAQLTAGPPAADGIGSTALTVNFGFGPALFAAGRYDLAAHRPAPLRALPTFIGDALDPAACDGDLAVQLCATDPGTAQQALRTLLSAVRPRVRIRWRQSGFRGADGTADPRNLFGFRDETANLDLSSDELTRRHLWVDDGPAWLHGGCYLVARRIRLLLDTWDQMSGPNQEATIGRTRQDNHRLSHRRGSHAAVAAPEHNGGVRLLRRSYSYEAGVDPNGLLDSGVVFLCYQRDPQAQFAAIQRKLAARDPLNGFSQHRASAVFACPPAARPGSFIGADLLS